MTPSPSKHSKESRKQRVKTFQPALPQTKTYWVMDGRANFNVSTALVMVTVDNFAEGKQEVDECTFGNDSVLVDPDTHQIVYRRPEVAAYYERAHPPTARFFKKTQRLNNKPRRRE